MQNKSPIFLNCFSRGGSNILWNLLLSHPDLCSPIKETCEIFRTGLSNVWRRPPTLAGYTAAWLSGQRRLFDQWNFNDREVPPYTAQKYIDRTFHRWKMKTLSDPEMCLKTESEHYLYDEVEESRLVAKNNNGLIFLTSVLKQMYVDATFFALVRHPFAVYESHRRRKITSSPEEFALFYRTITLRMIQDSRHYANYHIVKFESLLEDPEHMARSLYLLAGVNPCKVEKFRFKAKEHWLPDGRHASSFAIGHHFWFESYRLGEFLESNINELQAARLTCAEKDTITRIAGSCMQELDYVDRPFVEQNARLATGAARNNEFSRTRFIVPSIQSRRSGNVPKKIDSIS